MTNVVLIFLQLCSRHVYVSFDFEFALTMSWFLCGVVVLFVLATVGLITVAALAALYEWDIDAGTWVAIIVVYVSLVSPLFLEFKEHLAKADDERLTAQKQADNKRLTAQKEADDRRETLRLSAQEELRTILPKRQDAYTTLYLALSRLIPPK